MKGPGVLASLALALLAGCSSGDEDAGAGPASTQDLLADATRASGLACLHRSGAAGEFYFPEIMGPGGALLDYDADGDLDVYCVQGGSLAGAGEPPGDRLFRNDGAPSEGVPRFTDVTAESGIRATGYGMGAAVGDFDGDGWPDLYVTNFGSNQLWRNRGDGRFEDVTRAAGVDDPRWSTSAAFLDFDRDGHLDLFLTNYVDFRLANHTQCKANSGRTDYCAPSVYRGEPDHLFRNRGDGSFEDATGTSGLLPRYGNGLGVVTADFDGDGWIDIYVANDQEPNFLWRNRGDGSFEEVGLLAGAAVNMEGRTEASMGIDAGDVDDDGDEDLFMTHLSGETNTLYINRGDGSFDDRTLAARLARASLPFTGFGAAFLDVDTDGSLDILAVNGAVHTIEALERAGDAFPFAQSDQLFRNLGDGTFEDATSAGGAALAAAAVSRGLAVGDVDNDGDSDAVVFDTDGPARLLLTAGAPAVWVGLRLVTGRRDALGARVELVLADGSRRFRRARSDASYLSANDPRVLLALAEGGSLRKVRVTWPSGRVEDFPDVPTGRYTTLVEGSGRLDSPAP